MRVLFVDHDAGESGSTISLLYILRRFLDAGEQVQVLTPKPKFYEKVFPHSDVVCISSRFLGRNCLHLLLHRNDPIPQLNLHGLYFCIREVCRFCVGFLLSLRVLHRAKPDIVYVNEYVALHSLVASKLMGIRSVVHIRSPFLLGRFGCRRRLLMRAIHRCADAIIAISKREASQIYGAFDSCEKLHIIGEFLDASQFAVREDQTATRQALHLPPHGHLITMLGGIAPIKGTLTFLEAACEIAKKRQDVSFVVAGPEHPRKHEYRAQCRRVAQSVQLAERVFFCGVVSDVTGLLSCSTLLVSSNTLSHFSRPTIEAWAQKKPVVATATEHNLELVRDGLDAVVTPVGDASAMAEAIENLIVNRTFAGYLGENGFQKANRNYRADANTERVYALCRALYHPKAP